MDSKCLLPGQNWELAIEDAISKSGYFLALLSANSVERTGYVQKELKIALGKLSLFPVTKVFIIPVRIDDCKPSDPKLKALHWIDMFPERNWSLGMQTIKRVIGVSHSTPSVKPDKELLLQTLNAGLKSFFDAIKTAKTFGERDTQTAQSGPTLLARKSQVIVSRNEG